MARPAKTGGKAAKDYLQYVDPLLSNIVDIMCDELDYRQRYHLRIQVIKYKVLGERRRSKDREVQALFQLIIQNFVEPDEIF